MPNVNPPIINPTVLNAHGEPRTFIRLLPENQTCKTCAPRGARLGVIWENAASASMTVECVWCGNEQHLAYVPPMPLAQ